jgi:NAD(P)-dependent dehydrogenase (short-subunit alcohol dehydrogenase family)
MDLQLKGQRALVTGSTAGIGYAIAEVLAAEGARVIVNGRTAGRVDEALAKIRAKQASAQVEGYVGDLGKAGEVEKLAKSHPEVDILVNNLGIYGPKAFEEITDADWNEIIEVNFLSGVRLSRLYLPKMKKKNQGRILFIASESAVNIPVEMIHYGVTKTMQVALARGLAETTIGTKVTVNSVLPGPTWSEGVEQFVKDMAATQGKTPEQIEKEFFQTVRPSSLIQRFATVDEVAAMVAYLSSPLASATNGAAVRVEGGCVRSIL